LKTRLLEIVSQLIFTLHLAKGSTVVCQDVHPDLIAFVRTRLFEICGAKVGLLVDQIYVSSLPSLRHIFNSELETTHWRTHLERARRAKRKKRIQRKQILDDASDSLEACHEAFLSRCVHSTEPPIDLIRIPPDSDYLCVLIGLNFSVNSILSSLAGSGFLWAPAVPKFVPFQNPPGVRQL
jgi:hypothetical protein